MTDREIEIDRDRDRQREREGSDRGTDWKGASEIAMEGGRGEGKGNRGPSKRAKETDQR